jgi:hypothetical protein
VRQRAPVGLGRAEVLARAGRLDIARGLLEEVLELDLRRVSSHVRSELRRRRKALSSHPSDESGAEGSTLLATARRSGARRGRASEPPGKGAT